MLDTRNPAGTWAGPALAAGAERSFALAGRCGIPATARAVSANLTVTGAGAAGYLRAFAADLATAPATSNLNFGAGQIRANNAVVAVSQDGNAAITVLPGLATGTVNVIFDVNGYFQ